MSKFEDDLKNLKDEALSKKDAEAALFGPGGLLPAGAIECRFMLKKCSEAYSSLDSEERALVRKLARALNGVIGG